MYEKNIEIGFNIACMVAFMTLCYFVADAWCV